MVELVPPSARSPGRLLGDRYRPAEGSRPGDLAEGGAGIRPRRLSDQRAVARHRHRARQQDAVGHQHPQRPAGYEYLLAGLALFVARSTCRAKPSAATRRRFRRSPTGSRSRRTARSCSSPFRRSTGWPRASTAAMKVYQGHSGRRCAEAQRHFGDPGNTALTSPSCRRRASGLRRSSASLTFHHPEARAQRASKGDGIQVGYSRLGC